MQDKTKKAIEMVRSGEKPFAVARAMGISASGLYVALARERKREAGICECCGQKLPEKQP
jgi:hypothetical protein